MQLFITTLSKECLANDRIVDNLINNAAKIHSAEDSQNIIVVSSSLRGRVSELVGDYVYVVSTVQWPAVPVFARAFTRGSAMPDIETACQYLVGVSEARIFDPDYLVFLDGTSVVNLSGQKPSVKCVESGVYFGCPQCGTEAKHTIIRAEFFDFPSFPSNLCPCEIVDLIGLQYIVRACGPPKDRAKFFDLSYRCDSGIVSCLSE